MFKIRTLFVSALVTIWAAAAPLSHAAATGDCNHDSKVGVDDAVLALRSAVGLHAATPEEIGRGDLTADGALDVGDATWILQIVAGIRPPVVPANPLDVTVRTDDARAEQKMITSAGGVMTATAENGTTFTLTFPEDGLKSEEVITMTPLAAVEGLPASGGLVGGVKLEPEGLRLWKSATLVIEPANPVPVAEEFPFMSREGGKDFHLYPLEIGTRAVTFRLYHFTEVGLARGTAEDVQAQLLRVPAMTEAQFEQRVAELFRLERESQLAGNAPNPGHWAEIKSLFRAYYEQHLRQNLARSRTDCEFAKESGIFGKALGWVRQSNLMGFVEEDPWFFEQEAAVMDAMLKASETCFNDAYRGCMENSNPEFLIDMLKAARTLALLDMVLPGMDAKIRECMQMRFVVEFGSQTVYTSKQPISLFAATRAHVRGEAQLRFTKEGIGGARFEGEGSLTYLSLAGDPGGLMCSVNAFPAESSGTFTITVWPNLNDYPRGAGKVVVQLWPSTHLEGWEMVPIDDDGGCGEKFRWDQTDAGTFSHAFFGAKGHYPFRMPVNGVHTHTGRGDYPGNTSVAETTVTLKRLTD